MTSSLIIYGVLSGGCVAIVLGLAGWAIATQCPEDGQPATPRPALRRRQATITAPRIPRAPWRRMSRITRRPGHERLRSSPSRRP